MREHLDLYVPSALGALLVLALWTVLARRLAERGKSRWRAVLFCLPLLLATAGYGLFWLGFFASPGPAVVLHAVRLTLTHFIGPVLPWIGGIWLILCGILLLPLLRSPDLKR